MVSKIQLYFECLSYKTQTSVINLLTSIHFSLFIIKPPNRILLFQ